MPNQRQGPSHRTSVGWERPASRANLEKIYRIVNRFALLHFFHACGHLGFVLLFQKIVIICLRLIVTAGQVRELLFDSRLAVQASLIVVKSLPVTRQLN